MNLPRKYQVFPTPVEVSSKDYERLSIYLSGWNKLNTLFLTGINEPDLRRLVVMEAAGAKRPSIIKRLLGRLGKLEKARLTARIECL